MTDGQVLEFYTSNSLTSQLQAQILKFNLKQIGLNVNVHQFARAVQIDKEGTRGEPFDIASEDWIAGYADQYDFINVLLSGDNPHRIRIHDRDSIYSAQVDRTITAMGLTILEARRGRREPMRFANG